MIANSGRKGYTSHPGRPVRRPHGLQPVHQPPHHVQQPPHRHPAPPQHHSMTHHPAQAH